MVTVVDADVLKEKDDNKECMDDMLAVTRAEERLDKLEGLIKEEDEV